MAPTRPNNETSRAIGRETDTAAVSQAYYRSSIRRSGESARVGALRSGEFLEGHEALNTSAMDDATHTRVPASTHRTGPQATQLPTPSPSPSPPLSPSSENGEWKDDEDEENEEWEDDENEENEEWEDDEDEEGEDEEEETGYCVTCDEDQALSNFSLTPLTAQCTDIMPTCDTCTRHWVKVCFVLGVTPRCPGCSIDLDSAEILRALALEEREEYNDGVLKRYLSTQSNFQWCLNTKCSCGAFHCGAPLFPCTECGHKSCIACGTPWHDGQTCAEHQSSRGETKEDKQTAKMMAKTTKACPRCKAQIAKGEGCDFLRCTNCGADVCWECGCEFRGMERHARGCTYAPSERRERRGGFGGAVGAVGEMLGAARIVRWVNGVPVLPDGLTKEEEDRILEMAGVGGDWIDVDE